MNWRMFWWVGLFWVLSTYTASATPCINEVAWMGTIQSPTNEWVELYNDTPLPVDLSGWTIETEDGSLAINLSGVIVSNGYFLIERTDDNSVPTVAADLVAPFGAGLSNSGETLRLVDKNGVSVDTVNGGVNWASIGGNNKAKETAQRTLNGWATGAPTPRKENIKGDIVAHKTTASAALPPDAKTEVRETGKGSLDAETGSAISESQAVAANAEATILWESSSSGSGTSGFFDSLFSKNALLLWALLLVVLFAFAGFVIVRSQKGEGSSADDYTLVEDIIENDE
ncbi:MAG TPA: lamin tail domain-containing protein [Candidatus Paceibacterota bacterium]